ncbi:predicted protein [Histoplasma mississippiense (nom. inval.)]|uniref:predicted protein n=1 Tax=Ajellomyces capsulatus (strain NAm1 / WU24) TaxID=2059318 RepID=UPI000157D50D|nr:predicted protein [Histoplasma mississippiense (nom. inval.)]EDN05111.1 predicted protein [Histoplasma mississippiense (nom. inval.)]
MPASHGADGCDFSDESDYADDVFSDHSDENTDGTEETDSEDSDDSDAEISEEDKLPPPEHYEAEETTLDVKRLRQRRLRKTTVDNMDRVRDHWHRYCEYMRRRDVLDAYQTLSIQSLKGFLSWACDQRRGKGGRRRPGIQVVSSLETFWKQFSQVYKQDTGDSIDPLIMAQAQDVIELIADEKKLSREKRPGEPMYVDDLAEYLRVLLVTNEMEFLVGWLRVELILFCQIAGVTGNRPDALTQLRYRDLELTLVRDPHSSAPRLCVGLTAHFTKTFLGMKDANTFWLPEIIYDPTLVLSPHVFLLGMLFYIQAFKSPGIRRPEDLYSLGVLNGLNQQQLPLRDDLADLFVFCSAVREGGGVRIAHEIRLTTASVRTRMKKGGEITGFQQVTKPYVLRDAAAKGFNESSDVSDSLQNLMLQHASIDTFLKHYLDRNITADVLSIYRGLEPQKALMRMVCSMSRSIDPRRPWKLTPEQSRSVNDQPPILKIARRVAHLKKRRDSTASWLRGRVGQRYRRKAEKDRRWEAKYRRRVEKHERRDERYHKAVRRLRNEKQRARIELKRKILERYRQEQPVIDSERQLSGKVVDEDVRSALERSGYMTPEQMIMIDAVLTLPPKTPEAELQRRITAIHAVSAYCGAEEGPLCRRRGRGSSPKTTTVKPMAVKVEVMVQPPSNTLLESAVRAVRTERRPKICFLCLQNTKLSLADRVYSFHEPGDLTKHFQRRHLEKFQPMDCDTCNVRLKTLKDLLFHAETAHGTVTRSPKYRMLAKSGEPGAPTGRLPPSSQPSWYPRGNQCEEVDHQGGSSMCAWKPPLVSQTIRNSSRPHLPLRFPFAFNQG